MQSYVLQVFEIVATTGAENFEPFEPGRIKHTKKEIPIGYLLFFAFL